jgi:hypothetical protein
VLTLPWTVTSSEPDGVCTVLVGRLALRSYRDLPAMVFWTSRTRRSLATAPGLAGHTAAIELSAPALWIVSAWTNRSDLVRFDRSAEHQAARSALSPHLWPPTFAVWTCRPADLPVTWAEARHRIDAASPNS